MAIDARIKSTRYPYQMSGNYVQISPSYGLQCWNKLQMNKKKCQDFEIRFCCRYEQFPCDGTWTQAPFSFRKIQNDLLKLINTVKLKTMAVV